MLHIPDSLVALGRHQRDRGDLAGAARTLGLAAAARPDLASADLGAVLARLDRLDEAAEALARAVSINPADAEAWAWAGHTRHGLGDFDCALAAYDHALALQPRHAAAVSGKALTLDALGASEAGVALLDDLLDAQPALVRQHLTRGLLLLRLGRFEAGWAGIAAGRQPAPPTIGTGGPPPRWLGTPPLAGRRILVCGEWGLGDTIQFIRYAPLLADRGAQVAVRVHPDLVRLCRSLRGVSTVSSTDQEVPEIDAWCPVMDLPHAFATTLDTVPAQVPYLAPSSSVQAEWAARLGADAGRPRIGVTWACATGKQPPFESAWARRRSLPGALVERLSELPVTVVSLQKDRAGEDLPGGFVDLMPSAKDFEDNAALMAQLDLVVTVDTSMAHLAGAIGKPVWLLLNVASDWRWMTRGNDSPWYPTMRLFRQRRQGDWDELVGRVMAALRDWLGKHST